MQFSILPRKVAEKVQVLIQSVILILDQRMRMFNSRNQLKFIKETVVLYFLSLYLTKNVNAQSRTTVTGATCEFPQIYNKVLYEDCYEVDGVQVCQVDETLEECIPVHNQSTIQTSVPPSGTRSTIDGRQCSFPFIYRGETFNNCIIIARAERCITDGDWVECAPVQNNPSSPNILPAVPSPTNATTTRSTIDGRQCVLPFIYRGIEYNECIEIAGKEQCQIDGEWIECISMQNAEISEVRYTTHGAVCDASYYYQGEQYTGCMLVNGNEYCEVKSVLYECQPVQSNTSSLPQQSILVNASMDTEVRYTTFGKQCDEAYYYRGVQYSGCMLIDDVEYCEVQGVVYPCEAKTENSSSVIGTNVDVNNASFDSPTQLEVRYTVHGQECDSFYYYQGQKYSGCMIVENSEHCEVGGILYSCAPLLTQQVSTTSQLIPSQEAQVRYTTHGQQCDEEYYYKGEKYSGCIQISDSEYCEVSGVVYPCASEETVLSSSNISAISEITNVEIRYTEHGQQCDEEYFYRGEKFSGCIIINNLEYCEASGIVYPCAPRESAVVPQTETFPITTSTNTAIGQHPNQTSSFVESSNDRFIEVRYTYLGQQCDVDYSFQGQNYSGCIIIEDIEYCGVGGILYPCILKNSTNLLQQNQSSPYIRKTTTGELCQFPVYYEGQEYNDCFMVDNQSSCIVQTQIYQCDENDDEEEQVMRKATIAPYEEAIAKVQDHFPQRNATDGQPCDYPYQLNLQDVYGCIEVLGKEMCKVNEVWKDCAPVPSTSNSATLAPENEFVQSEYIGRTTTDGQECDESYLYNKQIETGCITMNSGAEICLSQGMWKFCSPLNFTHVSVDNNTEYGNISMVLLQSNTQYESRQTVNGQQCMFPFPYQGELYYQCILIGSSYACYINGAWEKCESNESQMSQSKKLSGGAIAGIVISVLVFVICIVFITLYILYVKSKPGKKQYAQFKEPIENIEMQKQRQPQVEQQGNQENGSQPSQEQNTSQASRITLSDIKAFV
eukprot:TRINITY_DN5205_c0_g2_i1.p1 TRINITY_DN5205_c0_g2~~TRINITY_DN5205_c0_g2_i1.p1  ORF type:complete len:1007 (-),score=39.16 TRINITY_DN5205_c0_g2_i1:645-3665(-)